MSFPSHGFPRPRSRPPDLPWDRMLVGVPLVIVLACLLYLAFASVYRVDTHERAVVMRFGKYQDTVGPGLHFCIPLVEQVLTVSTADHTVRLPWGTSVARPMENSNEEPLMLTGDLNAAAVEWTIQWKVAVPELFLFKLYRRDNPANADQVISTVAQSVMNRLVGDYSIDEVLTEKRGEIREQAMAATQKILDDYQCGVAIRDLQMQRVSPPQAVRPAFDQVNSSIQQRDQLLNEANKLRAERIPKAQAEKDKMERDAKGYADRRRAEANGDIQSLLDRYHAYQKAPEVTRQRLYLESMQNVLSNVPSKVIIDGELGGHVLPLLPLDQGTRVQGATQ